MGNNNQTNERTNYTMPTHRRCFALAFIPKRSRLHQADYKRQLTLMGIQVFQSLEQGLLTKEYLTRYLQKLTSPPKRRVSDRSDYEWQIENSMLEDVTRHMASQSDQQWETCPLQAILYHEERSMTDSYYIFVFRYPRSYSDRGNVTEGMIGAVCTSINLDYDYVEIYDSKTRISDVQVLWERDKNERTDFRPEYKTKMSFQYNQERLTRPAEESAVNSLTRRTYQQRLDQEIDRFKQKEHEYLRRIELLQRELEIYKRVNA